jgi:hypothetical protein
MLEAHIDRHIHCSGWRAQQRDDMATMNEEVSTEEGGVWSRPFTAVSLVW